MTVVSHQPLLHLDQVHRSAVHSQQTHAALECFERVHTLQVIPFSRATSRREDTTSVKCQTTQRTRLSTCRYKAQSCMCCSYHQRKVDFLWLQENGDWRGQGLCHHRLRRPSSVLVWRPAPQSATGRHSELNLRSNTYCIILQIKVPSFNLTKFKVRILVFPVLWRNSLTPGRIHMAHARYLSFIGKKFVPLLLDLSL